MNVDFTKDWPDLGTIFLSALISGLVLAFFPKIREDAGFGDLPFWIPFMTIFFGILTVTNLVSYSLNIGTAETEIAIYEKKLELHLAVSLGISPEIDKKILERTLKSTQVEYLKAFPDSKNLISTASVRELHGSKIGEFIISDDKNYYTKFYIRWTSDKSVNVICSIEAKDKADFDQSKCDEVLGQQFGQTVSTLQFGRTYG